MSFLDRDGYINTPEFITLVRDIDKLALAEGLKPAELWFSKKAIVRADHPSAAKLDRGAFEKKRAQPIKMRKRPPTSGSAVRMMVLLRNYKGLDQYADYWKDYQVALRAIERHNQKADTAIGKLKDAANLKRDKLNAAFDANIDSFIDDVIGDNQSMDFAIGTSMMGKTLIVKLPNGGYVSIGKADKERFLAAKESESAPATAKAKPSARGAKPAARGAKPAGRVAARPAGRVAAKPAARAVKPAGRVARAVVPAKRRQGR